MRSTWVRSILRQQYLSIPSSVSASPSLFPLCKRVKYCSHLFPTTFPQVKQRTGMIIRRLGIRISKRQLRKEVSSFRVCLIFFCGTPAESANPKMQSIPLRKSSFGEFVLEIDKLIKADREFLNFQSGNTAYGALGKSLGLHATSVALPPVQLSTYRDSRPQPTFWQHSPPAQSVTEISADSPSSKSQDTRQLRLFKTRFCSYGADCPYMAKGKCLYAHNKDEIRLRPPPPTKMKSAIRQVLLESSLRDDSVVTMAPDHSPSGSNESVWTLPESPANVSRAWGSLDSDVPSTEQLSSLFDCLKPNTAICNSGSQSTLASSNTSSFVLNVASSIDC